MASSRMFKLFWLLMVSLVLAVGAPKGTTAAITCGEVSSSLAPCLNYVEYGGQVPAQCCAGIKTLYSAAASTPDRQAVCRCLTSAVKSFPVSSFTLGLAAGLPAKCNVNLPYKIDPNTNCDNVKY